MTTITKLEDFKAWQKAREMNLLIFSTVTNHEISKHSDLCFQMKKSSRSVMANLAEGFSRKGNKEFLNFISIAIGSLTELKSDIYICSDLKLIPEQDFKTILELISEVEKASNGMAYYLRKSEFRGVKFKNK